ncbi:MAG: DUF2784 domain-containing protein [Magnetococcales bacterium]|nr:DUF2784 domain-containing protein [Magnetococcales bacterium]
MIYRLLADGVVCLHLIFVTFVLFGGMLVPRWPVVRWLHLPSVVWGMFVELAGVICPLTYLENDLRRMGREAGYATSFVEHWVLPLIYPDYWFSGGFPTWGFTVLGVVVLVFNGMIYLWVWRRYRNY